MGNTAVAWCSPIMPTDKPAGSTSCGHLEIATTAVLFFLPARRAVVLKRVYVFTLRFELGTVVSQLVGLSVCSEQRCWVDTLDARHVVYLFSAFGACGVDL